MATLSEIFTNIANAIRSKKGTTNKILPSNMPTEIESIEGGGGGATLLTNDWVGTAVPYDNTTTIENIYVNTNLPKAAVAALIQNNVNLYPIETSDGLAVIAFNGNEMLASNIQIGICVIADFVNGTYYFVYDSTGEGNDITLFGFSGWNPDFNGVIAFNSTNAILFDDNRGSQQGNEALKSLFSIAPFTRVNVELSGEYTGETLTITESGTTDLTNDIVNEKKIVTNLEINILNYLQTLVTGRGDNGGYYLCDGYKGDNVDFLADIDFSATRNMQYMFYNCINLTTIPQLNTSNVTDMSYMFFRCNKLTTIPLLDTSSVTNMHCMFLQCKNLTTIPQLNTSKVTNMGTMFSDCTNLTTIPQLDTSSVTNMSYMFRNCSNLTTVDFTHLDSYSSYFAQSCYSLTKLIIRTMDTIPAFGTSMFDNCYHFTGTVNATYNPDGLKDGRIYVPDAQVDALKAATGWADFADIIVPLSTLVE